MDLELCCFVLHERVLFETRSVVTKKLVTAKSSGSSLYEIPFLDLLKALDHLPRKMRARTQDFLRNFMRFTDAKLEILIK